VKPPDLDRIRFVTRHFNELKGLTLVSSGLIFMSLGVPFLRRYSIVANLSIFGFRVALLAGGFVLTRYAKAYYQRIGEVQSLRTPVLRQEALSIYSPGPVPRARDATAEFNVSLLRITGLTKGNLSSHLSKLEEAGLVEIEKRFVGKKTQTLASLSDQGRGAVGKYWQAMGELRDSAAQWLPANAALVPA
jgi:DNA-binding transcriptional ArsR family regulator